MFCDLLIFSTSCDCQGRLMCRLAGVMSRNPLIILIGLPRNAPNVPQFVKAQLIAVAEQMRQQGINFELVGAPPDECVDKLKNVLSGHNNNVDGVVIGNGIRSSGELTVQFEQLVNVVRERAPTAKLLFNTTPADTIDAIRRWFPIDSGIGK